MPCRKVLVFDIILEQIGKVGHADRWIVFIIFSSHDLFHCHSIFLFIGIQGFERHVHRYPRL
jgi:hypothetical protein